MPSSSSATSRTSAPDRPATVNGAEKERRLADDDVTWVDERLEYQTQCLRRTVGDKHVVPGQLDFLVAL